MTKQEQNDIVKYVWTEKLMQKSDLKEDIANGYSVWLQAIIKQAALSLTGIQPAQENNESNSSATQSA